MNVCRYFLQGNCRYGENCRYQHTVPNYNSNINQVRQHQTQLSRQQPQGQLSSKDFCDMVKQELELAERCGQWALSCYCPAPSRSAALPGLDDYSPEEIRYLMYQAQTSGNVQACKQHIQKLYQGAHAKKNIFKSQSPECIDILERVRSGPASPSSDASLYNPFLSGDSVNSSVRSIFGGSAEKASVPSRGVFGGASAGSVSQASVFGGASNEHVNSFGSASASHQQPTPIFGGGSATAAVNSFIGGGQQPYPLGASSASAPLPQSQGSTFGGASYGGQPSIFGGQTGGSSNASIFGGASPAINSFSFAAAAQNQGLIGSAPTLTPQSFVTDPFPSQVATAGSNIFGGSAPSATISQSVNPFGTATTHPTSVAPSRVDSGAYTDFNELTEEEKAEFMAPLFTKGRIPLRPPPSQLLT